MLEVIEHLGLGGGLNLLDEEGELAPNEFRELLDVSLEDGKTLQLPPGDSRINKTAIAGGGSSTAILMLAEYNKSSGTPDRYRYVKCGSSIFEWALNGTISAAVQTGLDVDDPAGWAVHNDLFLLFDKSGNYITNGSVWGPLGADAPAAPGLALAAGAELEVGAYQYRVSLYSTVLVQESTLSVAASVTTTPGNERVTVSGLPTLDSIWDRVRVYRTLVGGTEFYLHSTRSSAADFTDTTSDATLSASTTAPTTDTVKPPAAAFGVVHQNRLWLAGFATDADAVRCSDVGKPYAFPTGNRFTLSVKDGDDVTGLWVRGTRLFMAKEHKIFELLGDAVDNYMLVEVETGRGLQAARTLTTIGDAEFILDLENGPFIFGASESKKIGVKILPDVRGFNASRRDKFVAGHEPMSRAWYVSVASGAGVTVNDRTYVYHYERGGWCRLRLANVGAYGLFHDSSERLRLVYGTDYGHIHMIDADGNRIRANLGGALSGSVVSSSGPTNLVTSGGVTTTGNGWANEYLTVIHRDSSLRITSIERIRVASNTASAFTLVSPGMAYDATTNDLWFAGAFWLEARSGKSDFSEPRRRKHVPWWWIHYASVDHAIDAYATAFADDNTSTDYASLAKFAMNTRSVQQLPFIRGGGGRRPNETHVWLNYVGSNQPCRFLGWSFAIEKSAYDRPKTALGSETL